VVFPADVHPTNTTAADEAIVPASGEDSERNSVASFRGAAADKRASASSGDRTSGGRTSSVESLAGVRQRLDDAHAAGRRFRRRVQLPIMLLGMTMHCGGFALVVVAAALGEWSALHFAPSVIIVGSFFTMSALLSSNHRLIDVAYTFCALTCSALSVGHASLLAIDMQGYEARSPSPSGGGACAAFILGPVECAFLPIEMAWSAASIVPVLVLLVHMLRWRLHALPWRSLLDRLWVGLGRACMTWGACTLIYLCVAFGMGIGTLTAGTLAQRRYWWSMVVGVLTGIGVGGLCLHPQTRVRMQAFLASRSETVAAATGVAALLGDAAPEIVLARGVALFRSIRIADLTEADLESNSSSAELYARSTPAHFHQVDAFVRRATRVRPACARGLPRLPMLMLCHAGLTNRPAASPVVCAPPPPYAAPQVSHSWSDPAESKFLELVKWRTAFVRRHGREPTVWLDKACLSQSNLSESLGSLPVFLAGCNSLLVLAGESYTSRLWSVAPRARRLRSRAGSASSMRAQAVHGGHSSRGIGRIMSRALEPPTPRPAPLLLRRRAGAWSSCSSSSSCSRPAPSGISRSTRSAPTAGRSCSSSSHTLMRKARRAYWLTTRTGCCARSRQALAALESLTPRSAASSRSSFAIGWRPTRPTRAARAMATPTAYPASACAGSPPTRAPWQAARRAGCRRAYCRRQTRLGDNRQDVVRTVDVCPGDLISDSSDEQTPKHYLE
jgi:hypothetical protein